MTMSVLAEAPGAPSARPAAGAWRLYLAVLAMFLAVYALTVQRGPAWQDSGIYQWRILHFDVAGWNGLALSHPLLIVLGELLCYLPFGPLAWRMNLVSAICGAVAVSNVALLVRRMAPGRPAAAWFAAGAFGLAHTTWWLSTICESQAVFAALFTVELNVLASLLSSRRGHWVVILGAVNGLALTAHDMALLAAPVYAAVVVALAVRRRLCWYAPILLAGGWAVGAAGFLTLIAEMAAREGLPAAVHSALFGQAWRANVLGGSLRAAAMGGGYILYNLPNAALPLAVLGFRRAELVGTRRGPHRALGWSVAALATVYLLFAIRYTVVDQFMFFLPFYATTAVLAGLGLAKLPEQGRRWLAPAALVSLLAGPLLCAAAPAIAKAVSLPVPGRKDLPLRDAARYWLSPWKGGEDSAGRFARLALRQVPPVATIIADSTSLYPLLWVQTVERVGPDVRLVGSGQIPPGGLPIGQPDVFIVSASRGYYPAWLDEYASFHSQGGEAILFRVVWHSGGAAPSRPAGSAGRAPPGPADKG